MRGVARTHGTHMRERCDGGVWTCVRFADRVTTDAARGTEGEFSSRRSLYAATWYVTARTSTSAHFHARGETARGPPEAVAQGIAEVRANPSPFSLVADKSRIPAERKRRKRKISDGGPEPP